MNYEYIRRLTKGITQEGMIKIGKELLSRGIKLYEKTSTAVYTNLDPDSPMGIETDIYVAAADLDAARACVAELKFENYLCPLKEAQPVKSAAEIAEEEYFRKRKKSMIECLIVLAAGLIFFIYKSLAG